MVTIPCIRFQFLGHTCQRERRGAGLPCEPGTLSRPAIGRQSGRTQTYPPAALSVPSEYFTDQTNSASAGQSKGPPVAIILKSANLSVSPDAAWDIVDRFMRADIRVFSFIKENRIDGPVRTVISEGLEQPELNITIDPEHMYASYSLLESPYWTGTFHHGCMRVFDTGDGRCRFEWITDVAPDSWATKLKGEYLDVLWSELVKVLETGEEAPPPPAVPAD